MLRQARRSRGLTQRQLAAVSRVAQPAIARIESGASSPRIDTLQRLLVVCGRTLEALPVLGAGIDRTGIREILALTPLDRLELAAREANLLTEVGL